MRKLAFALAIGSAMMLSACNRGNQDQVNNAELNQPAAELNALANEAVNTALEANALANQAQNLENAATNVDDTVNPKDADEQNVSGM
jgi:hypothetical protein